MNIAFPFLLIFAEYVLDFNLRVTFLPAFKYAFPSLEEHFFVIRVIEYFLVFDLALNVFDLAFIKIGFLMTLTLNKTDAPSYVLLP